MVLCSEVKHSITAFHVVRGSESVFSRLEGTVHRKRLSRPRVKPPTGQATDGCDGGRDVSGRIDVYDVFLSGQSYGKARVRHIVQRVERPVLRWGEEHVSAGENRYGEVEPLWMRQKI